MNKLGKHAYHCTMEPKQRLVLLNEGRGTAYLGFFQATSFSFFCVPGIVRLVLHVSLGPHDNLTWVLSVQVFSRWNHYWQDWSRWQQSRIIANFKLLWKTLSGVRKSRLFSPFIVTCILLQSSPGTPINIVHCGKWTVCSCLPCCFHSEHQRLTVLVFQP